MATELPMTNGFYVSSVLPISHQRCSNCYPSKPKVPALSEEQLLFTPGATQLASAGDVLYANRGSHVKSKVPYFVNGNTLYKVTRTVVRVSGEDTYTYVLVSLGTIEGSGRVSMADNGTQLMVLVPGGKGYIYNEDAGTPFQEITDSDFTANGNPQITSFIDGYFLVTTDSKKFIISSLNDGLTWDALDFATAESDPDIIVAPIILNGRAYIAGSETTEGYQNLPSVGRMPFIRNNVILDKGCKAPFSLVKTNSSFFMIGAGAEEAPAVWQFLGGRYRRVSTEAIEQLLSTYTEEQVEDIYGLSYSSGGAYFVIFTLPDTTICFDLITEKWHERNSQINETESPWRVSSIVQAYGITMVGDTIDGRIGHLSLDYEDEYGANLIRLFSTQPFAGQGDEITPKMIELTMESGVGDANVPDPVVSLATSSNAKTFTDERPQKIGKAGDYGRRIVWYRNGRYDRFAVLQFRLSEPVGSAFIKLEVE